LPLGRYCRLIQIQAQTDLVDHINISFCVKKTNRRLGGKPGRTTDLRPDNILQMIQLFNSLGQEGTEDLHPFFPPA
jgi:hypothetical protein